MFLRVSFALLTLYEAFILFLLLSKSIKAENVCTKLNSCSGHGSCTALTKVCECYDGYGSPSDKPATPISPDCSELMCPMGAAWGDIPTGTTTAHEEAECSAMGICDRSTGLCSCFEGFEGNACQRYACPQSCSGHGTCLTLNRLVTHSDAQPLNHQTTYGGYESTTTWDENKIAACLCDSSWTVGLGNGETQLAEFFGPDCSLRHCPSGDDPMTSVDETDCENKLQDPVTLKISSAIGTGGGSGNKCHIDCSNRGICDYATGNCMCFSGYSGINCDTQDALSPGGL